MNPVLLWGSFLALGAGGSTPPPAPSPITLELRALGGPRYEMILTNATDRPVPVLLDRHLLYFEADLEPAPPASVPGKAPGPAPRPRTIGCTAPADARPTEVRRPEVHEIAPGQAVREPFDLRAYCWGSRQKLAGSYQLRAYYGFGRPEAAPPRSPPVPRRPVAATAHRWVAPGVAEIAAPPIHHEAESATPTPTPAPPAIAVRLDDADVDRGPHFAVSLTVRNRGDDPLWLYVRPSFFSLEVEGLAYGHGSRRQCRPVRPAISPIRDFFLRLGRSDTHTVTVDAAAFCPPETFARPGVYDVTPVFESTYDGRNVRLDSDAWTGTVRGPPAQFRIRLGASAAGRDYAPNPPAP